MPFCQLLTQGGLNKIIRHFDLRTSHSPSFYLSISLAI